MALRTEFRASLPGGVAAGVVAFLLTYGVAHVATAEDVATQLEPFAPLSDPPAVWEGVGWVVFAMHNVPVRTVGTLGGAVETTVRASELRETWLLFVPVVLLAVAGALVAAAADAADPADGALAGGTVVVGYLPVSVLALVLVRWSLEGSVLGTSVDVTVGPDPVAAVLVAGLLYPLALGVVGGAVAGLVAD